MKARSTSVLSIGDTPREAHGLHRVSNGVAAQRSRWRRGGQAGRGELALPKPL